MCTEDDALVRLTAAEEHYLRTALALLIAAEEHYLRIALALLVDEKTRDLAELDALDPASPGKGLAIEDITEQLKNIQRLAARLDGADAVFVLPDPED